MGFDKDFLNKNKTMLFGFIGVIIVVVAALSIFYFLQASQYAEDDRSGVITPIIITSPAEAQNAFDEVSVDISGLRSSLEEIDLALSDTNS